jgi:hypothetical protein
MKTLILALLLVAPAAHASSTKILDCAATNGDDTQVNILQRADGSLYAAVSTESFGDSHPTFRFDVTKTRGGDYVGKSFSLKMKNARIGMLHASSIGVSNEVDCKE